MKTDFNALKFLRSKIRILEREFEYQLKSDTVCCGVTLPQCHIILELADRDKVSITELSGTFGLDKSTLSRTVDSMVDAGFVNRNTKDEDRRFYDLTLTKKGKDKAEFINSRCNEYYSELLKDISEEKQNMIIEGVSLLSDIMQKVRTCCKDDPKCKL
jgi:DNA-binding MarR family transcriptional regulator